MTLRLLLAEDAEQYANIVDVQFTIGRRSDRERRPRE
jgi:hypothetical protein